MGKLCVLFKTTVNFNYAAKVIVVKNKPIYKKIGLLIFYLDAKEFLKNKKRNNYE